MGHEYALDWLDQMVSELDPQRAETQKLDKHQSRIIIEKAAEEEKRLLALFKHFVFQEKKNRQIKNLVNQYLSAAVSLVKTAKANLHQIPRRADDFRLALESILSCLSEVSAFIAYRYSSLVDQDMPLCFDRIHLEKHDITRLGDFQIMKINSELSGIVVEEMRDTMCDNRGGEITMRKLDYQTNVNQAVSNLDSSFTTTALFDQLETILIERNFNSPRFIKYLTAKFSEIIANCVDHSSALESLISLQKTFNQIPVMREMTFSTHFDDLTLTINTWLIQEIDFRSKKGSMISSELHSNLRAKKYARKTTDKILCNLTVDQLSLLFKAADLSDIISARSLSAIFQSVAPYLATPNRTEISPGSLRTKSYSVEERDKSLLIDIMTRLIEQIKDL